MSQVSDGGNPRWTSLVVIVVCLATWAALLPGTFSHNSWVYSWDSAAYIETAQSLVAGRGLSHRVIFGTERDLWEPLSLWPPGYSVLIAVAQIAGLPAVKGGVAVSVIAGAISAMLLAWICLRLFHWAVAFLLTLTIIVMPAFLQIGTQCLSDSSYFALVLASIACLMQWTMRPQPSLLWVFGAGLFAGASWGTRYAGSALFAATGLFFLLHLSWLRFGHMIKLGLVWLLGLAVFSVPLVIRNLMTFGQISPYNMPPSNLSLWVNARQASSVIVEDMTASALDVNWIVDKDKFPIYGLIFIVMLAFWGWRTSWPRIRAVVERQRVQIFLAAYLIAYTAIVIVGRTKYRWGEDINPRYMVQIYWILWVCAASCLTGGLRVSRISAKFARVIVVLGLCGTLLLQLTRQLDRLNKPADRPESVESKIGGPAIAYLSRAVGKGQIVFSMRADLLRIHSDINARKLPPVSQYDFLRPITRADINRLGSEGFLWGIVIESPKAVEKGNYDALIKDILERPENYPELERVKITSPAIIFRYSRNGILLPDALPPQSSSM
jgi:hypothetical protein